VNKEFTEDGGLMQYGWDALQDSKRVATYVRKILQDGEKPTNLPVQQSDTVRLVLNRKAAREIGITFPQELLLRADEVIE
jgi:putative ABC transport system substrate-binding protein